MFVLPTAFAQSAPVTKPSGLVFQSITEGKGPSPAATEGVQLMKAGGKAKLTCPPAIAYGTRGAGGVIPPNATLNFEIELISIKK